VSDDNGNGNVAQRFEWSGFGMTLKFPGKRAAEIIATLSLLLTFAIGSAFWLHRAEANENAKDIKMVIEKSSGRQERILKAMLKQQVFQSCIQQYDMKDRPAKILTCRDLSQQAVVGTEN
jgi:hypothetical protein